MVPKHLQWFTLYVFYTEVMKFRRAPMVCGAPSWRAGRWSTPPDMELVSQWWGIFRNLTKLVIGEVHLYLLYLPFCLLSLSPELRANYFSSIFSISGRIYNRASQHEQLDSFRHFWIKWILLSTTVEQEQSKIGLLLDCLGLKKMLYFINWIDATLN